jgi:8-oxo-dGTP diphosphatase
MIEERSIKQATTAVILHQGHILIGKRRRDGLWELPGGKIDPGENAETCIHREVKEELNINIKIEHALERIEGTFRGIPMVIYGFLATWTNGAIDMRVHADIQWITIENIFRFPFIEEDLLIIQRFIDKGRLASLSH